MNVSFCTIIFMVQKFFCYGIIKEACFKEEIFLKKNIRFLVLTILLITAFMLSGCDLFIKTNDGRADLKWYMGLTYEDENGKDVNYTTESGDSVAAVALEDKYSEQYAIMKDADVYVNIDMVKNNIDDRFYFDNKAVVYKCFKCL